MRLDMVFLLAVMSFLAACSRGPTAPGGPTAAEEAGKMTMRVESSAFTDGNSVPKPYTCDGDDRSPPLTWTGAPNKTESFALIVDDPDAPGGTFTHWIVYNLAENAGELKEGMPPEGTLVPSSPGREGARVRQGKNDFGKTGYGGPCPPRGKPHHYRFTVYALDSPLNLGAGAAKDEVLRAMKGHILAEGRLVGTYGR